MEKHKLIEMTDSTYAVLLEGDKVEMCQEHWSGKGQDTKIFLNKDDIIKLAEQLKGATI